LSASQTKSPAVYTAIAAVMADIAKEGISKSRSNQSQGYKFRGIDDVYNALAPILAKHHLCLVPQVLNREVVERTNTKGTVLFYVTCQVKFTLVSAEDGSSVEAVTYGEAMDSGDKATNKAMSAAYKYMAMQTFCIPTEGDNDADATTHEVAPRREPEARRVEPTPPTLSARADRLETTMRAVKSVSELDKAFNLAAALCAELSDKDPARLAKIEALRAELEEAFAQRVAA
jgi:hypothetical protein